MGVFDFMVGEKLYVAVVDKANPGRRVGCWYVDAVGNGKLRVWFQNHSTAVVSLSQVHKAPVSTKPTVE